MKKRNENLLEGLKLIFEKEPNDEVCAEHDIIYVGELSHYTPEEQKKLKALGFHKEKDVGRWGFFV